MTISLAHRIATQPIGFHVRSDDPTIESVHSVAQIEKDIIAASPHFRVENVSEHFRDRDYHLDFRDLPNLAPPFPEAFFEWTVEGKYQFGVLVQSRDLNGPPKTRPWLRRLPGLRLIDSMEDGVLKSGLPARHRR